MHRVDVWRPSQKVAATAVLAATAIILSPISFPIGPTKVYPAQHMINGIGGVLLGPWYAMFIAFTAAIARNALGTGTVFAFPGGIPGAFLVGFIHRYIWRRDYAALTEPLGTAFGAIMSATLVGPLALQSGWIRTMLTPEAFLIAFLISSVPGSIIGFAILVMLRKGRIQ
ncbi:energy coupling factor transporter S component ThiW [Candidatus Bathyarchaeota archaeon]|nr:energy coupling factor transporter S component ThiW [Candidatus Bathyarchaeota archaeon]